MEAVRRYWNQKYVKEDDVSRGVYDYHTVVGVALLCNGIVRNEKYRDTSFKFVWPFCSFGLGVAGFAFGVMQMCHCLDENNIPVAAENFFYILLVTCAIVQVLTFTFGRNIFQILGDLMDDDFAIVDNLPLEYRELFFKHQLLIKKLTIGYIIYAICIYVYVIGNTVLRLICQQLFSDYTVDRERPLIIKIWLPRDDPYRTPLYEIFFFLQILLVLSVATVFVTYCLVHLHYNLHILCQFDLVILGWQKIFNFDDLSKIEINKMKNEEECNIIYDILKKRIKENCIRHRHALEFFERVNSLLGPMLFVQLLVSSIGLCLLSFEVIHSIEIGQFNFFFLLLFLGCLFQIAVPCLTGSLILQKASEVGFECYSCGWETMKLSKEIKLEILTSLLIANQPVATKALGLTEVSLVTFTSIVQAARSYYITLRQLNKDGL